MGGGVALVWKGECRLSYKSQHSQTGHSTCQKTFRARTNFSHGRETHSLQLHARPVLGPFPRLVPGQPALRSDLRDATLLRGDAHLSQHTLARIHPALWISRNGLFNAEPSGSDAHVALRHHDAPPELQPGPVPTAELRNV